MSRVLDRHTWNPVLHIDVVGGSLPAEELRRRTLSLMLEDNARKYDQLEWRLDNRDGMLTDVRNLALGLIVRVRYGYANDTSRWRTFIITRCRGGVGVKGVDNPAVGQNESVIMYYGRNRNAPNLKSKRGKNKGKSPGVPKPSGDGVKTYSKRNPGRATGDIIRLENIRRPAEIDLDAAEKRVFEVRRTSDAVREIARQLGFADDAIYIEETSDDISGVVIPSGMTIGHWLKQQQVELDWILKTEGRVFRFHSQRWTSSKDKIKKQYTYGGPYILRLNFDFDFRLPMPNKVQLKGRNVISRYTTNVSYDELQSPIQNKVMQFYLRGASAIDDDLTQRLKHLSRDYIGPASGATKRKLVDKAARSFVRKHVRAIRINAELVGDPDVEAGDSISLAGIGNELFDGAWFIEQAKHIFSGTTYVTRLDLRVPGKKSKQGAMYNSRYGTVDPDAVSKGIKAPYTQTTLYGTNVAYKQLGERNLPRNR